MTAAARGGDGEPWPVPFVVGAPRSGTTLLRLMLDAHPGLAIPHETGFVPEALALPPTRQSLAHFLVGFHTWADLATSPAELDAALAAAPDPFTVSDGLRAFYRAYSARHGKARWGDKTPGYGLHVETIAAAFPEVRFVHLVRDGRDVAASIRNLWFAPGSGIAALARDWAARVLETRRQAAAVPGRCLEVRYEALVMAPERELRRIAGFLSLDFHPAMLRHHEHARRRLREAQTWTSPEGDRVVTQAQRLRNQRAALEPPDPGRIGRWRDRLSFRERREFEREAGETLELLGYH